MWIVLCNLLVDETLWVCVSHKLISFFHQVEKYAGTQAVLRLAIRMQIKQ